MATRMLQRRGTAAEWTAANPVLSDGELGWERDTNLLKVGDGVTAWNALSYIIDPDLHTLSNLDSSTAGAIASDGAGWIKKTYAQFKTALVLVKGDVGLGNVDNTSDVNKPVSTAQAAADATKQPIDPDLTAIAALDSTTAGAIASDGAGWIKKTYAQFKTALALVKADVGLGNVDNTSDVNKPVSTAQQTALNLKQDSATAETSAHAAATYATIADAVSKSAAAQQVVGGAGGLKGTNGVWDGVNRVYSAGNPPPSGSGSSINQTIRGTVALSSTTTSITATIASVNTAKTQLRHLGDSGGSSTGPGNWYIVLTDSVTITATRSAPTASNATCSYEVTEWT